MHIAGAAGDVHSGGDADDLQNSGVVTRRWKPVGIKGLLASAAMAFLAGCAGPGGFEATRMSAEAWAAPRGFVALPVDTGQFALFSLLRQGAPAPALTVYIEGDGAPWPTVFHPPRDPTPLRPLALQLAASDPAPAVAYLARPCQYRAEGPAAACDAAYWTDRRFAPEVLAATDLALTRLKLAAGAHRLRLVGFSGGGVIAALLASRRDDVDALVTVAAPLALAAWVELHQMSPLTAAADPVTDSPDRRLPPAVHFVGADDDLVPAGIVGRFARVRGGRLEVVPGFDHDCCWVRDWPQLLRRVPAMENLP